MVNVAGAPVSRRRHVGTRRRSLRAALIAALTGVALGVAACGGGSSGNSGTTAPAAGTATTTPASRPVDTSKTTLRFGFFQEPPNWDFIASDSTAIKTIIGLNVIETLLQRSDDGKLQPLLAKSYKTGDGGRQYELTLQDATFQDGSPMTSADVVYSMDQYRKSKNATISSAYKGVSKIEAVDDHTVRVTLKQPSNSFLGALATEAGFVIKKGSAASLKTKPMGTGPFAFSSWRQGVGLTLNRYDGYWGKKPVLKTVKVSYITDGTARINQLRAGQLDLVFAAADDLPPIQGDPRFKTYEYTTAEKSYLALNAKDPTLKDPKLRQGLAEAIDPKAIIKGVLGGLGTPLCVLISPGEPGYTNRCAYSFDPASAKELLAEAGVKTLRLKYISDFSKSADVVSSALKEVGVTVKREPRDLPTYLKEVLGARPDYQLTVLSGPQSIDAWRCPGWFVGYCDKAMDKLLDDADTAPSPGDYARLRQQAAEQYAKQSYVRVWASAKQAVAGSSALQGIRPTIVPLSEFDFRGISFTTAGS